MRPAQKASAEAYLTPDRLSRWNHIRHRAGLEDLTKEQAVAVWATMTEESKKEARERLG